jgi:hypothetical protein
MVCFLKSVMNLYVSWEKEISSTIINCPNQTGIESVSVTVILNTEPITNSLADRGYYDTCFGTKDHYIWLPQFCPILTANIDYVAGEHRSAGVYNETALCLL